jgi:hypothetical protein
VLVKWNICLKNKLRNLLAGNDNLSLSWTSKALLDVIIETQMLSK